MKKTFLIGVIILTWRLIGNASVSPALNNPISVFDPGDKISRQEELIKQMKWFVSLTAAEYGKLRGKKLGFFGKIAFSINRHRMKKMLKNWEQPGTLQKISWFVKGIILGPIAVILAYAFLRDEERELIKWAWFGFATIAIVFGVLLLTL